MKTFKPLSFTIEISERPRYIPGSGPPMMPISLLPPDGKDWRIHSVVNLNGIPQYLITPPDNPAHRVPVRKELILNWVSPRTYEDFEYLQAKKRDDEEWDEEKSILTRALQPKKKGFRMFQTKNAARSKAQQEDGITGKARTGSDPYPDSDNESVEFSAMIPRNEVKHGPSKRTSILDSHKDTKILSSISIRDSSRKRKDSSKLEAGREPDPKRQKLSRLSQNVSLEPSLSRPIIKQEPYRAETPVETSSSSSRPILPPPRAKYHSYQSSLLASSQAPTDAQSRRSSSGDSIRISRILPPPRPINFKAQRSSSKGTQSSETLAANSNSIEFREYPPILPPQKLSCSQHTGLPAMARTIAHISKRTTPWTTSRPKTNDSQTSVSTDSEPTKSATPNSISMDPRNGSGIKSGKSKSLPGNIMKGLDMSKITQNRSRSSPSRSDENRRSLPISVERLSSTSLRASAKSSRSRDLQRAMPVTVVTPKKGKFVDEAEEFEIFGLIDDEIREVDGVMVRYYLVDWRGDSDPTWEAEYNVSEPAIKAYKKKLLRRQAFDGSHDGADDIPASPQKPRNQSVSHIDIKVEADEKAIFDIPCEFPTNSYYRELDDSDLQAAILIENGYEDEMKPLEPVQENRRPPEQLCSI